MTPAELRDAAKRLRYLAIDPSNYPGGVDLLASDLATAFAAMDTLANFLDEPSLPDTEVLLVAATQRVPAEPLYCDARR